MISESSFYLKSINNKIGRLANPIVLNGEIELPKNKSIHINMLNTIAEDNFESLAILHNIDSTKLWFYNSVDLTNPIGKIVVKPVRATTYGMDLKKAFRNSKIVSGDSIAIRANDLFIFNYKLLHDKYKYQNYKLRLVDLVNNALINMVYNINERGDFRHSFIIFDLPREFPKATKMNGYADKEMNSTMATYFNSVDRLLVFELFKLFYKKSNSILRTIKPEKYESVFLTFKNNGKMTVYRLSDLLSLSKKLEVDGNFSGKDEYLAAKTFIFSLYQFSQKTLISNDLAKGIVDDTDYEPTDEDIDTILDSIEDLVVENEDNAEGSLEETGDTSKTFNKLPKDKIELSKKINEEINDGVKNRTVSKSESSKLEEVNNTYLSREFNVNGSKLKLETILDYEAIDSNVRAIPIKDSPTVLDKLMLDNTNRQYDEKYLKEMYHKDIYNAIYSMHNAKVLITNHTVTEKNGYMGGVEEHTLELKPLDGKPSTVKLILPKIDDNGVYKMSGNEYLLRYQRKDLPIRKTSTSTVLLTSYKGKLFIEKNVYQKNNPSEWLAKYITNTDSYSNIILKGSKLYDLDLPIPYTTFSNTISRFTLHGSINCIFDYNNRLFILDEKNAEIANTAEKKEKLIFIGIDEKKNLLYFMNSAGEIYTNVNGSTKVELSDSFDDFFNIDIKKMPIAVTHIKVLGRVLPLGLIILYFLGIDELLKRLKVDKRFYSNEDNYKLEKTEYKIVLSDGILVFDRKDIQASLLLSNIDKSITGALSIADLNNKIKLSSLFNILDLSIPHKNAIDDIEDLFLDNITIDSLKEMGEPTEIHDLLLRAVELLMDDNYKNPNNITDNAIVRYERVAGLVNKSLSSAIKTYRNRNTLSKSKITMDPYEVWKAIGDDSTSMLVENNNPIATIKQRDNVTFLGEFGRNRITMTIPTRAMTPEEVGIISEASPDSGDSGISTYLTHGASIKNLRGMVDPIDISKFSINKALSTANIINPHITTDDSKRANFASIQLSHIIAMTRMRSTRIWTGAEAVIANKVGKPFVEIAESFGKVLKKTPTKIEVEYYYPDDSNKVFLMSDGSDLILTREVYEELLSRGYQVDTADKNLNIKVFVGKKSNDGFIHISKQSDIRNKLSKLSKKKLNTKKKSYSTKPWSSKVEGGTALKHIMVSSLNAGDEFSIDQPIIYDAGFFEPNIYDKKSLVLKMGDYYNVAFVELPTTYEDSIEMNSKILGVTGEDKYTVISKVLDVNSHITNVLDEGEKVEFGMKLMTIVDASIMQDSNLSELSKEILSEASDSSPKANVNGIIDRIDIIYNCNLEDMDSSIRALADKSNKRFMEEKGVTGEVTSEYSIEGVPLQRNEIELKYYINHRSDSKIGDKFIIGHQLKNTIGDIKDDIRTIDGEQVDLIFSTKSTLARITASSYINGTAAVLMKHKTNEAIKNYRK